MVVPVSERGLPKSEGLVACMPQSGNVTRSPSCSFQEGPKIQSDWLHVFLTDPLSILWQYQSLSGFILPEKQNGSFALGSKNCLSLFSEAVKYHIALTGENQFDLEAIAWIQHQACPQEDICRCKSGVASALSISHQTSTIATWNFSNITPYLTFLMQFEISVSICKFLLAGKRVWRTQSKEHPGDYFFFSWDGNSNEKHSILKCLKLHLGKWGI